MDEPLPRSDLTDAAWIKIVTRLDPQVLLDFCYNLERLYRLNPYLSIEYWMMPARNLIKAKWRNSSTPAEFTLESEIQVTYRQNEIRLCYCSGLKKETSLIIEPHEQGSSLTVIDDYSSRADRKDSSNLPEQVDRSLQAWGAALKSFLFHYNYLRKIPGIECVIDRFWVRLSPMARRITYLLVVITVFELVLLLVFTGVLLLK